ncbi:hypothetical protein BKA69DRAFT_1034723 [Paraphysoderma sedebokerense]|nr:hypothetical protein BKA69DRAFT_1034723 [Paraphysoderma sedebokerense]
MRVGGRDHERESIRIFQVLQSLVIHFDPLNTQAIPRFIFLSETSNFIIPVTSQTTLLNCSISEMDNLYLQQSVGSVLTEAITQLSLALASSHTTNLSTPQATSSPSIDPFEYIGNYLLHSTTVKKEVQASSSGLAKRWEKVTDVLSGVQKGQTGLSE